MDIEVVRIRLLPLRWSDIELPLKISALAESCHPPFRARDAAGPFSPYFSVVDHGVPCLRYHLVSPSSALHLSSSRLTRRLSNSEGTHAKYHYLICGVQGDFTRSLVNDPPTHLWTRQLKVGCNRWSKIFKTLIFVIPVCWCFKYIDTLQEGYSCVYRNRIGCRSFDMFAKSQLVSALHWLITITPALVLAGRVRPRRLPRHPHVKSLV